MKTSRIVGVALSLVGLLAVLPGAAMAEEHHRWHGGDIRHFEGHDRGRWEGGHWFHGPHLGRPGWWWIVGGVWYFYPQPVYPYPDPYLPPAVVAAPAAPPGPQYWYYCDATGSYYPYVATCPSGWRPVPATPAP